MNTAVEKTAQGPILKNGIKGVHEAFADYMLINPGCTLKEMSAVFNYSSAWICTVINSDMFKAYFAQRRQGINCSIAEDLPGKLAAAAHLATERIIEVIQNTEDADTLIDAFDKVLHRHGFAPNAKGGTQVSQTNIQNNVFYLTKGELGDARQKLLSAHVQEPAPIENKGDQAALPAPS